ncbi:hypothetical protein NC99_17250 [Sunxiuqinia dokdonensis]|uniref:Uncharacterized protein n=1 Tax=Sunxiuqinia dokdonensis TaxID=1409788 RepID=A0A0L8VAI5_9BACT|nr:hypothetical protein NC99_17250 [Sunxiuqinia dokdonensis]
MRKANGVFFTGRSLVLAKCEQKNESQYGGPKPVHTSEV